MGRYDFRPCRVLDTASMLLKTRRIKQQPPWYQVLTDVPTSQSIVRTQPVQHRERTKSRGTRKASKLFKPQQISYEEDDLRLEFFKDHPWELARPRVIVENDGKDYQKWDWSKDYQTGRPIQGESVIQRQMWLAENSNGLSQGAAYDQARKEYYTARHFAQMEARIAREEALSTGAYFGKTVNEIGTQLENEEFDRWRVWAQEQVAIQEQAKSAAYTGIGQQSSIGEGDEGAEGAASTSPTGGKSALEAAAEELGASINASKARQTAP